MEIRFKKNKGVSFIDVIVGVSIMLIVFIGFFGALRLNLVLVTINKNSIGALALGNEQLEYIRSLSYDDVGTDGGIPSGAIAQSEVINLNKTEYTRRTFIQYVDDPQDGLGAADTNGITADYKIAKVEMQWTVKNQPKTLSLISNIVPKGMESLAGGGTLTINVFDALGAPVVNAEVNIVNDLTLPPINVTVFTGVNGSVSFPGAPAASEYEINVTKSGYNSAQTYDADISNPNPNPAHLSVVAGDTTTSSFIIDFLSDKIIYTYEPIKSFSYEDLFINDSKISSSTPNVEVTGGAVQLIDSGGYSLATGTVYSLDVTPTYLYEWGNLSFNHSIPANTNIYYHIYYYDSLSELVLVPDIDLPNNSTGFNLLPVDISVVSTSTYSTLILMGELKTDDSLVTPSIQDWELTYLSGPTPLPNLPFNMRGEKVIGSDGGGIPIYKYDMDLQTDANGSITQNSLEWDTYTITVDDGATGYDIIESCDTQPFVLEPNVSAVTTLTLDADTNHTLLVSVRDNNGDHLSGAQVRLFRAGFEQIETTSSCGQVFFSDMAEGTVSSADAYSADISAAGYQTENITDVDVSGISNLEASLAP